MEFHNLWLAFLRNPYYHTGMIVTECYMLFARYKQINTIFRNCQESKQKTAQAVASLVQSSKFEPVSGCSCFPGWSTGGVEATHFLSRMSSLRVMVHGIHASDNPTMVGGTGTEWQNASLEKRE